MFQRSARPRLPLKRALALYWPWLSGLVVAGTLTFWTPTGYRPFGPLGLIVFFGGAFMAMWPTLKLDAPYSFWIVACLLWFCIPFVMAVVAVALGLTPR